MRGNIVPLSITIAPRTIGLLATWDLLADLKIAKHTQNVIFLFGYITRKKTPHHHHTVCHYISSDCDFKHKVGPCIDYHDFGTEPLVDNFNTTAVYILAQKKMLIFFLG